MGSRRRRMAARYARRANLNDTAVTISFGFSSLPIAILAGVVELVPYVGVVLGLLFFHFHRTVLVTEERVYIYRDLPFHQPGSMLAAYPLGQDVVTRVRGKLTFLNGVVVWHSPLFAWRVRQVAEAIQAVGSAATKSTPA